MIHLDGDTLRAAREAKARHASYLRAFLFVTCTVAVLLACSLLIHTCLIW